MAYRVPYVLFELLAGKTEWASDFCTAVNHYCQLLEQAALENITVLFGFNPSEEYETLVGDEVHKVPVRNRGVFFIVTVFDRPTDPGAWEALSLALRRAQWETTRHDVRVPLRFNDAPRNILPPGVPNREIFKAVVPAGTSLLGESTAPDPAVTEEETCPS